MENNKGQTIFLSVIGVATLLVAIIGATFAYFTASVDGNQRASSILVNTAVIASIDFIDGAEIEMPDALPGTTIGKDFTVALHGANITTVAMNYRILLSYTNTAGDGGTAITDLKYNLTVPTGGTTDDADLVNNAAGNLGTPSQTNKTIGFGTFAAGVTDTARSHLWHIDIIFPETNANQNSQQGAHFAGILQVEFADAGTIYYTSASPEGTNVIPGT